MQSLLWEYEAHKFNTVFRKNVRNMQQSLPEKTTPRFHVSWPKACFSALQSLHKVWDFWFWKPSLDPMWPTKQCGEMFPECQAFCAASSSSVGCPFAAFRGDERHGQVHLGHALLRWTSTCAHEAVCSTTKHSTPVAVLLLLVVDGQSAEV